MSNIIPTSPHKDFEAIKKLDSGNFEYWEARELMPLLDYKNWRDFNNTITKAIHSAKKTGQSIQNHFERVNKMIKIATGSAKEATRNITDYKLSRYACYLIAQNGDPRKQAIANAQTYFAIQTRRQEVGNIAEDQKRLFIREEIIDQNKKLQKTASRSGVTDFGTFNDFGYLGLYGMHLKDLKDKKGLGKDNLLDRAGSVELAANLFRITQTEQKLEKDNVQSQGHANITHLSVGHKVRETIKSIGGAMPENLPPQTHIKKLNPAQPKLLK
jgi:DNA-damage-inducible protein D